MYTGHDAMLIYCTLFDSQYLSRGITMYESLFRQTQDFRLYIFAFDDLTLSTLQRLHLKNVVVVPLSEFEDEQLRSVKHTRTTTEYCWTATSSTILYVLKRYHEQHCTYIDADMYFFGNPNVLFDELGSGSIMITEHRYTPRYDLSALSGIYCVQYITFKNDSDGLAALRWWRNACIDWCYAREENGKFGDQKYLDDWTERFAQVHVMKYEGGGVAPWNIQQYEVEQHNGRIKIINTTSGKVFDLVFYHFHYLRFYTDNTVDLGDYRISERVQNAIYVPYLRHLDDVISRLAIEAPHIDWYGKRAALTGMEGYVTSLKRLLKQQYNVFPLSKIQSLYPAQ